MEFERNSGDPVRRWGNDYSADVMVHVIGRNDNAGAGFLDVEIVRARAQAAGEPTKCCRVPGAAKGSNEQSKSALLFMFPRGFSA